MTSEILKKTFFAFILCFYLIQTLKAQETKPYWAPDGFHYYRATPEGFSELDARDPDYKKVLVSSLQLTPQGAKYPLVVENFSISANGKKVLLFTNTKRVWRYKTRGDYWVFDLEKNSLQQLGLGRPESSLMFAKFSPDGAQVAYVSEHNLYTENLATGMIKPLTLDGTKKLINGTFDWVYEEEFDCRDGFRWAPDSKSLAYWQIDARSIKNYFMLNTTDSIYPFVVPVEYPVAGENPSSCRIGIVDLETVRTTWMNVPGDPIQHYITRMEWMQNSSGIILEQLNRAQTECKVFIADKNGNPARLVHEETEKAWFESKSFWNDHDPKGWEWLKDGKSFLWVSEKDGWRHIYKIDQNGKEKLLSPGNYDMISLVRIDEEGGYIYMIASPENATQRYLYRIKLSGSAPERITPMDQPGTHSYEISTNGKIGLHSFSNIYTPGLEEVISLPDHKHISGETIKLNSDAFNKPEFFKVKTADGVEMDGWMVKPNPFDPTKKYPVLFYVYSEPAATTVNDEFGTSFDPEYDRNLANDGYIYISLDNRGTPAPKGAAWRKAIYKSIGLVNIRDQAMAAKEVLKFPFVDSSRIAVWGWSGGGSCTLNLLFQHPEIYKTGMSVAAVGWELSYDNVYQERYMGVPTDEEGRSYFIKGSPITYAKNLQGNLLYVHGTGDDNVHYRNAELLLNELIKYNKQFQFMSYPNRSHGIYEGEGTQVHLRSLLSKYLREHCPGGGK